MKKRGERRRRTEDNVGTLLERLQRSPAYRGKHVIVVGDAVYAASPRKSLGRLWSDVKKRHPDDQPTLAYVPDADTLILILRGR